MFPKDTPGFIRSLQHQGYSWKRSAEDPKDLGHFNKAFPDHVITYNKTTRVYKFFGRGDPIMATKLGKYEVENIERIGADIIVTPKEKDQPKLTFKAIDGYTGIGEVVSKDGEIIVKSSIPDSPEIHIKKSDIKKFRAPEIAEAWQELSIQPQIIAEPPQQAPPSKVSVGTGWFGATDAEVLQSQREAEAKKTEAEKLKRAQARRVEQPLEMAEVRQRQTKLLQVGGCLVGSALLLYGLYRKFSGSGTNGQ